MPLRPFDACIDGLELRHQILKGTYVDQGRFRMRHRQIRRADSNSPRQDEQGRTPFEGGPIDEAGALSRISAVGLSGPAGSFIPQQRGGDQILSD
jgi:hypothetical protein